MVVRGLASVSPNVRSSLGDVMTLKKSAAVAVALLLSLAIVGCGSKKNDDAGGEAAGSAEKQSQVNPDASSTHTAGEGSGDSTSSTKDLSQTLSDVTGGGQLGDCLGASVAYASLVLE